MLKELEETLKSHQNQINNLQKKVITLEAKNDVNQKITYTVKEASSSLGVKETTIRSWIAEGKLKAIQTGKNFLIPTESLMSLINQ